MYSRLLKEFFVLFNFLHSFKFLSSIYKIYKIFVLFIFYRLDSSSGTDQKIQHLSIFTTWKHIKRNLQMETSMDTILIKCFHVDLEKESCDSETILTYSVPCSDLQFIPQRDFLNSYLTFKR